MKKTLYLMRHGQTLFNLQHKIQGWCDSPLTELGIKQAKVAGKWFKDHDITFDHAYSSTSERCCDTLEIITDMPTFAQMKDQEQLQNLYDRFFERIRRLVKPGGYVFLYTSEISLVRKNLRLQEGYLSLEEHYEVPRGKNMFYFFIIKVK